jgi:hypothetical protein
MRGRVCSVDVMAWVTPEGRIGTTVICMGEVLNEEAEISMLVVAGLLSRANVCTGEGG